MRKCITNLLFVFAVTLAACNNQSGSSENSITESNAQSTIPLAPADYINWIEDPSNGLVADKTIGDLTFSVFYKPVEYLVLKDLEADSTLKSKFPKRQKQYDGMDYFSFRIKSNTTDGELLRMSIKDENEYYARLEYISFKMQNDFKLITGTDTVDCGLYHYERTYGLAPHASFVLGFPKNNDFGTSAKQLLFEDKLFNKGNIYITIPAEKINSIPKLEI